MMTVAVSVLSVCLMLVCAALVWMFRVAMRVEADRTFWMKAYDTELGNRKQLEQDFGEVLYTIQTAAGGIFKLYDETYALFEYISEKAPHLFRAWNGAAFWLRSNHDFFFRLASAIPLHSARDEAERDAMMAVNESRSTAFARYTGAAQLVYPQSASKNVQICELQAMRYAAWIIEANAHAFTPEEALPASVVSRLADHIEHTLQYAMDGLLSPVTRANYLLPSIGLMEAALRAGVRWEKVRGSLPTLGDLERLRRDVAAACKFTLER